MVQPGTVPELAHRIGSGWRLPLCASADSAAHTTAAGTGASASTWATAGQDPDLDPLHSGQHAFPVLVLALQHWFLSQNVGQV